MKLKDIISSVVFLIIFVFMLMVASYALRPNDSNNSKVVMSGFYSEPDNSLDIIAVGSSSTYRYFIPMELYEKYGYTAYSMAIPSMRGVVFKYFIKEALKSQNPDLFIVDLRWFVKYQKQPENTEQGLSRIRLSTDNMKYSLNRFAAVNKAVPKDVPDRLSYFIDVIKYHGQWQFLDYKTLFYNKQDPLKGYRPISKVVKLSTPDFTAFEKKAELSEFSKTEITELLDFCRNKKLNILFVFSPYQPSEKDMMLQNSVEELIKSYGFDFINTNKHIEEMGIDYSTDLYNSKHTNILGALKYTEFLGKYINSNYNITNEHSIDVQNEWNKAKDSWNKKKNKYIDETKAKIKDL